MAEKVIIIGSGPAGWAAAIYASRANLEPLVIEGVSSQDMIPLGQLAFTTEVENYPGWPAGNVRAFLESSVDASRSWNFPQVPEDEHAVKDGRPHYAVQGTELMEMMRQQAINFGTRTHEEEEITAVDFSGDIHKLTNNKGETLEAHTVIVATGARANYLGLESEQKYKNKGVSACAVCDGALPRFRDVPNIVVGGGDSAVEEATYLAKFASKVYMLVRRDQMRASKVMQDRALNDPKIEVVWNTVVDECLGTEEDGLTAVRVKSTTDDSTRELESRGMFLAIGHTPNTGFLDGALDMNDKGYITWTKPFRTNTSADGVFAAGDVADDYYRQAITSAGTGCMAALDAERLLADLGI